VIYLDTNVMIALLNGRMPKVLRHFERAQDEGQPIAVSVVVLHELRYGAANSLQPVANNGRIDLLIRQNIAVEIFDEDDAQEAADIRAHLKRLGTTIGPYDTLIAGQARRRGATLVTANTREFERVPGLTVEDWS
jgi:tRNA(fMet)-specific endonuclease VapC